MEESKKKPAMPGMAVTDAAAALVKACNEEKLPMFFTAAVPDGDGISYYIKALMPDAIGVEVKEKDDKFPDLVNVMNGFSTIPPMQEIKITF